MYVEADKQTDNAVNNWSSEYKTDQFIIKYKDEQGRADFNKKLKEKFKSVEKLKSKKPFDVVITELEMKPEELLSQIKHSKLAGDIEYIQPDYVLELSSDDTYYNEQWSYDNTTPGSLVYMQEPMETVWEHTQGEDVIVAVIDTGVDVSHIDLKDNIFSNEREIANNGIDDDSNGYIDDVNGWDFANDVNQVCTQQTINEEQHGTHIAGIIASMMDNNEGTVGVAPKAKILPLKVFTGGQAYTSDIIEAIEYAANMGAKIINCSWGTTYENTALQEVIEAKSDTLFICAAGNSGVNIDTNPVYPAGYVCDNIITVASVNSAGNLSYASNYGDNSVDVAAPGVEIISTLPGNTYGIKSGTSMAAAFVSGEAALLFGEFLDIAGTIVKENIMSSSDKLSSLTGKVYEGNKINISNAIFRDVQHNTIQQPSINPSPIISTTSGGIDFTTYEDGALYSTSEASTSVFSVPAAGIDGQVNATIYGNTYTNLLGEKGSGNSIEGIYSDAVLSTDGNFITLTRNNTASYQNAYSVINELDLNKYYFLAGYIESTNGAAARVMIYPNNWLINGTNVTTKGWSYAKYQPSDANGSTAIYGAGFLLTGSNGDSAKYKYLILVEITAEEYNLSYEELAKKYTYVNGTQSTQVLRIKSAGKNLIPNLVSNSIYIIPNGTSKYTIKATGTPYGYISPTRFYVCEGQTYILSAKKSDVSIGGRISLVFYNEFDQTIANSDSYSLANFYTNNTSASRTINIPIGTKYVRMRFVSDGINIVNGLQTDIYDIQLEQGSTVTAYEKYEESSVYISNNIELNSLPNGIKDSIDLDSNIYTKKTNKIVLNGVESWVYCGDGGTNSYAFLTPLPNCIKNKETKNAIMQLPNYVQLRRAWISTDTSFHYYLENGKIDLIIPKAIIDTYAGSDPTQKLNAYLASNDCSIIYQLAQPQIQKLNIPPITCYTNGTIIVDKAAKGIELYNNGIGISNRNLPVKSIESIYKIQGNRYIPVDLSKVSIASDGLSFTISDAQAGERYEYVYLYDSGLSTLPTITYSVPTNTQAQINDSLNMIKQQAEIISSLEARLEHLESQSGRMNAGPFKINCTSGTNFTLVLTAANSRDFSNRSFTIIYNSNELDVVDLYAATSTLETGVCNISGSNITITKVAPGVIEFIIYNPVEQSTNWSGAVNSIIFKPKITGQATVTYTVQ